MLGSIFFNIFIKNNDTQSSLSVNTNNKVKNKQEKKVVRKVNSQFKFVAVQGGVFKNDTYLNERKNILNKYGDPFIISTEKGKRLFLGIYDEKIYGDVIKKLNNDKIDNANMVFTVNCNDICDVEICEILKAYLDILNKFSNKNVKSVSTEEFKKWTNSLGKNHCNCKNEQILKGLKNHINNLPNNIIKDNICNNYIFVFNILKKSNR